MRNTTLLATITASVVAMGTASERAWAQEMTETRVAAAITETIAGYNPYADSVVLLDSLWCKIYGCISRFDFDEGRYVPFLAERIEVLDDTTWEIELRSDWVRHNGDPVLAEDVIHSYERIRTDPQSVKQWLIAPIVGMEAVDELTVRITTNGPVATLMDNLSAFPITSKRMFDEFGPEVADRQHPYGAGPYRLVEVAVGSHMVLERFDEHPIVSPTNPQQILYRIIAEPEARITALLNGEVQIAQGVPPQLVDRVQNSPNARVEFVNSVELMFLAMNTSTHPWEIKEARQAVAHAIDREAIIAALLGGRATLLQGPVSEGQVGFDPDYVSPFDFNPGKARELLESAGLVGVEVELYTPVGRYTLDRQIAEAMVPMLEAVGFRVNLQTPEWATLWSNVQAGGVPFYYMGRGAMLDPSIALSQYFETGASPRLDFSDPAIDALLQAERREFEEETRMRLLREAMAALTEAAPAVFLWQHQLGWGVSDTLDFPPRRADRINGWEIHVR